MHTEDNRAVALLSAGLDSSVAMALAIASGMKVSRAITFDYGQRAASREIRNASRIAQHYGVLHSVIPLPWFKELWSGGALLTDTEPMPHPSVADLSDPRACTESARRVWVPNRNGVFLEIAAGIAESRGAGGVIVGFNREEARTFPDNSPQYLRAICEALQFSTANGVRILAPTLAMDKAQIVQAAMKIAFPLELLWSCYEGESAMCGQCESCMRLKQALAGAHAEGKVVFANQAS